MASSRHYARAIQPEYPRVMRAQDAADPIALHSGSLFLRNLPNADLRRLVPHLRLTDLPREEIICRDGDMIQIIIFPHDGIVSLTSLLTDGTIIESATVGGEGYVGVEVMLGSAVAACSVIAQPGRVSTIALDRLLILLDQVPSLRPAMLAYARAYLAVVTRLSACNALHTLKQRACRRLMLALDQTEQQSLMITQEELARALGVGRTSVNQACQELRIDGLIDYSRGHIQITNLQGMTTAACECYNYLKRALQICPRNGGDSRKN
jgi:CRP-like cAMP-binding protein